ncbi:hypothetical protein [Microviridae sp.]|nr:hypothetical protein [Microviridae sp.]
MTEQEKSYIKYNENIQEKSKQFKTRPEIIGQLMFLNDIINHLNTKLWHLEDAGKLEKENENLQNVAEVLKKSLQTEAASDSD